MASGFFFGLSEYKPLISVKIMKSNAIFMYIKTMFDQLMNDKSMNHILFKKRETKTKQTYLGYLLMENS